MKTLIYSLLALSIAVPSMAHTAKRMGKPALKKLINEFNYNLQNRSLKCGTLKTVTQTGMKHKTDDKRKFKKYKGDTCFGRVTKQIVKDKNGKNTYTLRFTKYRCGNVIVGLEKGHHWEDAQFVVRRKGALRGFKLGREGKTSTIVKLNDQAVAGDKDSIVIVTDNDANSCVKIHVNFK